MVWGDVRPAPFAIADDDGPQYAEVQFAPAWSNSWTTVAEVRVTNSRGYFQTWVRLPSSGSVRIIWHYPTLDPALYPYQDPTPTGYAEPLAPATSRTVRVTIA